MKTFYLNIQLNKMTTWRHTHSHTFDNYRKGHCWLTQLWKSHISQESYETESEKVGKIECSNHSSHPFRISRMFPVVILSLDFLISFIFHFKRRRKKRHQQEGHQKEGKSCLVQWNSLANFPNWMWLFSWCLYRVLLCWQEMWQDISSENKRLQLFCSK